MTDHVKFITVDIPLNDIDTIIEQAYASEHWLRTVKNDAEYAEIQAIDTEDKKRTISYHDLGEALLKVAFNPDPKVPQYVRRYAYDWYVSVKDKGTGWNHIDEELSDYVLQTAFYGEVLYG